VDALGRGEEEKELEPVSEGPRESEGVRETLREREAPLELVGEEESEREGVFEAVSGREGERVELSDLLGVFERLSEATSFVGVAEMGLGLGVLEPFLAYWVRVYAPDPLTFSPAFNVAPAPKLDL